MLIATRYDVNETFWVPRSIQELVKEELTWEGNTWYRDVPKFKAYAKKKRIVKIEASVNERDMTSVMYYLINDGVEGELAQVHLEASINDYTEEEALKIANEYAEREEAYYGL
jgi:hypothetical protein